MKALIFAAGRGERMRPLTENTPKPLLDVGGKPLIVWQLERLATAGIRDVVINTAYLAEQFAATLGNGSRWDLTIQYSHEGEQALETGGGIRHAMPLLGDAPFLAVNGDIFCDFDLAELPAEPKGLAHLLLVDNPPQHPQGDFALHANGQVTANGDTRLTFAGIGVYRPQILQDWQRIIGNKVEAAAMPPRFKLAPLLYNAAAQTRLTGQKHAGTWTDVGTPQRLAALQEALQGD